MPDATLGILLTADASNVVTNLQSVNSAILILQNQLERLQKIASLPNLNLNQISRIGDIMKTTQNDLAGLQRVASSVSPEFGKISNSSNELEKRIRITTSAEHEFNSILGSTPALLAGAEQPAQALGSELLILSTGIQRAREAGQSFSEIGSTLAASMFSLQGIITLGAAALFSFGKELFNSADGADDASAALAVYEQKLKDVDIQLDNINTNLDASARSVDATLRLKFAGIDPNSIPGIHAKQTIDTNDTQQALDKINGKIREIDKSIADESPSFDRVNNILQATISTYKKLNDEVQKGKSLNSDDVAFLSANAPLIKQLAIARAGTDVLKIPAANLDKLSKENKDLITAFQKTNDQINDLQKQRNAQSESADNLLKDSKTKSIQTQIELNKKQAEVFSQQAVDPLAAQLETEKTKIQEALKIQQSGEFEIPTSLIIPDSDIEHENAQDQKLLKRRKDLVNQLNALNAKQNLTGVDQSFAKADVQLEINKIDLKLDEADFNSAVEIVREKTQGLLKIKPFSLSIEGPHLKIGDIQLPSIGNDLQKKIDQELGGKINPDIFKTIPIQFVALTPENQTKLAELKKAVDNATSFDSLLTAERNLKIFSDSVDGDFGGITKQAAQTAKFVDDAFKDAFDSVVEAVDQGKNPLQAFFESIEKSLEKLVEKFVETKAESAFLSSLKISPQGSAISSAASGILGNTAQGAQQTAAAAGLAAVGTSATATSTGLAAMGVEVGGIDTLFGAMATTTAGATTAMIAFTAAVAAAAAAQAAQVSAALLGALPFFFADGGQPPSGKVSVVGEKGPELFVPNVPGRIIPNNKILEYYTNTAVNNKIQKSNDSVIHHFEMNHYNTNTTLHNSITNAFDNHTEASQAIPKISINLKISQVEKAFTEINHTLSNSIFGPSFMPKIDISRIPHLAAGGIAIAPTIALVGESGKEAIVPLNQLQSAFPQSATQRMIVEVRGVLKGRDMVLSNARTSKSQGRTG